MLTEDGIRAMSLEQLSDLLQANDIEIPSEVATSQEELSAWVITQFSS